MRGIGGNTGRWTLATALEQLQKCGFECEGGPLENNTAFQWLLDVQKVAPEYLPGQQVFFEVTADVGGTKLSKWAPFYVVAVWMDSGTDNRFYHYRLSNDPPQPWHYGSVQHPDVLADKLRLSMPAADPVAA